MAQKASKPLEELGLDMGPIPGIKKTKEEGFLNKRIQMLYSSTIYGVVKAASDKKATDARETSNRGTLIKSMVGHKPRDFIRMEVKEQIKTEKKGEGKGNNVAFTMPDCANYVLSAG